MPQLPPIIASAKSRPLSYNPQTGSFIYYDDVQEGKARLYPLDKLQENDLLRLAIERQKQNGGVETGVLNGNSYSAEEAVAEMRNGTKLGKQLVQADLDYLRFYLEQFPAESFDK